MRLAESDGESSLYVDISLTLSIQMSLVICILGFTLLTIFQLNLFRLRYLIRILWCLIHEFAIFKGLICVQQVNIVTKSSFGFPSGAKEFFFLSHFSEIWIPSTTLTELPEEDDVEKKAEQEESEEEFGSGIHPTAGKD